MRRRRRTTEWSGRARAIPALLFALVWVLGFEVVPTLHQALHASLGAHEHGALLHCHGSFCHASAEDLDGSRRGPRREGALAGDPIDGPRAHGDGSLEHRGIAALTPDLVLYVPEAILVGELADPARVESRIASFERRSPPVRGPPA